VFGDRVGGCGSVATAVGVEHVRLSYDYLDRGDADGYASLLDPAMVLDEPGRERVCGRDAAAGPRRPRGSGKHDVHDVFAADGRVIAVGRFRGDAGGADGGEVDFADVFTLSEHGLLLRQRCFYFIHPQ
jgi:ketosteroid isomerase-like protein